MPYTYIYSTYTCHGMLAYMAYTGMYGGTLKANGKVIYMSSCRRGIGRDMALWFVPFYSIHYTIIYSCCVDVDSLCDVVAWQWAPPSVFALYNILTRIRRETLASCCASRSKKTDAAAERQTDARL